MSSFGVDTPCEQDHDDDDDVVWLGPAHKRNRNSEPDNDDNNSDDEVVFTINITPGQNCVDPHALQPFTKEQDNCTAIATSSNAEQQQQQKQQSLHRHASLFGGHSNSVRVLHRPKSKYRKRQNPLLHDPTIYMNRLRAKDNLPALPLSRVSIDLIERERQKWNRKHGRGSRRSRRRFDLDWYTAQIEACLARLDRDLVDKVQRKQKALHSKFTNVTAHKYQQMLNVKDATSYLQIFGADILLSVRLRRRYRDMHLMSDVEQQQVLCNDSHMHEVMQYLYDRDDGEYDCFSHIDDDWQLCHQALKQASNSSQLQCNGDAFAHKYLSGDDDLKRVFKKIARLLCGGPHDEVSNALMFKNYRCIAIGNTPSPSSLVRPPVNYCPACRLPLQCIPLLRIGDGQVYCPRDEQRRRFTVHIYVVCFVCDNYPVCMFPTTRKHFHKYWVKYAWYNDVSGKEWAQRNPQTKLDDERKRKLAKKRKAVSAARAVHDDGDDDDDDVYIYSDNDDDDVVVLEQPQSKKKQRLMHDDCSRPELVLNFENMPDFGLMLGPEPPTLPTPPVSPSLASMSSSLQSMLTTHTSTSVSVGSSSMSLPDLSLF